MSISTQIYFPVFMCTSEAMSAVKQLPNGDITPDMIRDIGLPDLGSLYDDYYY